MTSPRRLRAAGIEDLYAPRLYCKRPGCAREVPPKKGRGRPNIYCSQSCSAAMVRGRRNALAELERARLVAAQYDAEVGASAEPGRPTTEAILPSLRAARDATGRLLDADAFPAVDDTAVVLLTQIAIGLDLAIQAMLPRPNRRG